MNIHCPEVRLKAIGKKFGFKHDQMGYRDVEFLQEEKMYLAINSDMDPISR
jgi:hypothetical protein